MPERSDPIRLSRTVGGRVVDALVSPVGASLQRLAVDTVELVWGAADGPVGASGAVLVPWPNRVRGGHWTLDGEPQQLAQTEPGAGNALHGLVAHTVFSPVSRQEDAVELAAEIRDAPGYPFDLDVGVSYRLTSSGVDSTVTVVNRGTRSAPVAVGVHPYLRIGDAAREDLVLTVDAQRTLLLGDDDLPRGQVAVAGTPFDLRAPTPLAGAPAHAAFTGLRVSAGRIHLTLADASRARVAEVWADERFRWAQVYVTDALPGLAAGRVAVALEPMTAPPDALNSGTDLVWLGPSARWDLSWGIATH